MVWYEYANRGGKSLWHHLSKDADDSENQPIFFFWIFRERAHACIMGGDRGGAEG